VIKFTVKYLYGFSVTLSQISYSLVVIFELNGVSEIQYKEVMIIGNE